MIEMMKDYFQHMKEELFEENLDLTLYAIVMTLSMFGVYAYLYLKLFNKL